MQIIVKRTGCAWIKTSANIGVTRLTVRRRQNVSANISQITPRCGKPFQSVQDNSGKMKIYWSGDVRKPNNNGRPSSEPDTLLPYVKPTIEKR